MRSQNLVSDFRVEFIQGFVDGLDCEWPYSLGGTADNVVVLLPGLGGSNESMLNLAMGLRSRYRVLCLGIPPGIVQSLQFTREFSKVLDYFGMDQCNLLGHSMGGMCCLVFAQFSPHRVKSLILANTAIYTGIRQFLIPFAAKCLANYPIDATKKVVRERLSQLLLDCPDRKFWQEFYLRELESATSLADNSRLLADTSKRLARLRHDSLIDIPTLIIQAQDDTGFTRIEKKEFACLFRTPQELTLPEPTGHLSFITREAQFIESVDLFLESHLGHI